MSRFENRALFLGVTLALFSAGASALPALVVSKQAASFTFDDSGPGLENDWTLYPTTLDGAQTLYSWNDPGDGDNSSRTVTYTGSETFTFKHLTFTGKVYWNTELGVPDEWGDDLLVGLTLNAQTGANAKVMPGVNSNIGARPTGTDVSNGRVVPGYSGITSRSVSNGTTFTFEFSEDFVDDNTVPDATYGQDFTIHVWAQPDLNFGNVRVGTTSAAQSVVARNAGDAVSPLNNVVFSAAPGDFNPGTASAPVNLTPGATTTRSFTYTPGEFGSDTGSVTVTADTVTSQFFNLAGNGVGPVFDLNGYGTSGTIDLGSIDVSAGATMEALTLQNLFGSDLGNLTDMTILSVGITGANSGLFSLSGLTGPPFELDAVGGGTNTESFNLLFDPTTAGTFNAILTFMTDVGAAKGATGATYAFDLTGVGTGNGGGPGPGPMPIPATALLLGVGLAGLASSRRRKQG